MRVIDIRRGEITKTLLMALDVLVIIAGYTMVKTVREAVFLARFDVEWLAALMIGLAVVAGTFTAIATRLGHALPRNKLILITHIGVAVSLLVIWGMLRAHVAGSAWVLYVWSSFFGLFVIANFWLLANDLYDVRAAKRLFAVLGTGAILGGVVGGEASRALAPRLGAIDLLPVVAGAFLVAAALAQAAWRAGGGAPARRAARPEPPRFGEGFRLIRERRYLRLIAAMLLLATLATTLIDMEVKSVAKSYFASDRDRMAAFFGRLTSLFSLVSLGVQLLITSRFLRRFGVGRALLVLPSVLILGTSALGFAGLLGIPVLVAAAMAKVGDGGLRFSLDKAAMELLYLPVPTTVKSKAKPVIDTVVDRAGTAATGLTWLLLAAIAGALGLDTVQMAALATLGVLGLWLAVIVHARREYVQAFRTALPGPPADPHNLGLDLTDRDQLAALREALRSPDERTVHLALEALATAARPPAWDEIRALVDHPSADVRALAFDVLGASGDRRMVLHARLRAADDSAAVRGAAVRYLTHALDHAADELVNHPDVRVRVATLAHLAERGPRSAARASGHLAELLAGPLADDRALRMEIALTLGALPAEEARRYLPRLILDPDPEVARAAGGSAGRIGDTAHVRRLLERLAARRSRAAARAALEGYGPVIAGALAAALDDPSLPRAARQHVPAILAAVGTQSAADALVASLPCRDLRVRARVVRSLWGLRRSATVRFDAAAVERLVTDEARTYATHLDALRAQGAAADTSGVALLRRSLAERLSEDLERLFRLLGLRYPQRDVLAAYYGIRSDEAAVRSSAIELLDNLLPNPLKREIISRLDVGALGEPGRAEPEPAERVAALRALAGDGDPWLRACAVYVIGETGVRELAPLVTTAAADADPRVREAAELAAAFLAGGAAARVEDAHADDH